MNPQVLESMQTAITIMTVLNLAWTIGNIISVIVTKVKSPNVRQDERITSLETRTDQIEKHLNKKLDVIKVRRLEESTSVALEMMLIKVSYLATTRSSLIELCNIYGAKIMGVTPKSMVIEVHASPDEISNFIELVRPFGILEVQRTGAIAMSKT